MIDAREITKDEERVLFEVCDMPGRPIPKNNASYIHVKSLEEKGMILLAGDESCNIRGIYLAEKGIRYIAKRGSR